MFRAPLDERHGTRRRYEKESRTRIGKGATGLG
jgi:hypothetical protein